MSAKELLKQITIIVREEFEHTNELLTSLVKTHGEIKTEMATKADVKKLANTIKMYMEVTMIYKTKQMELEKQIDAILDYLDIENN